MQQAILRVAKVVEKIERALLATSILGIAFLVIVDILARNLNRLLAVFEGLEGVPGFGGLASLLDRTQAVTGEVSEFLIIVVSFVGLSYAASRGRHVRMTAIYDQLPPPLKKGVMILITTSTSLLMFLLAWYSATYVAAVYQLGGIYPALRVPFFAVYCIAPLGFFLAGIQYALALARNLIEPEIYLAFDRKDEYDEPIVQEI